MSFQWDSLYRALNPVFTPKGILSPLRVESTTSQFQEPGLSNGVKVFDNKNGVLNRIGIGYRVQSL